MCSHIQFPLLQELCISYKEAVCCAIWPLHCEHRGSGLTWPDSKLTGGAPRWTTDPDYCPQHSLLTHNSLLPNVGFLSALHGLQSPPSQYHCCGQLIFLYGIVLFTIMYKPDSICIFNTLIHNLNVITSYVMAYICNSNCKMVWKCYCAWCPAPFGSSVSGLIYLLCFQTVLKDEINRNIQLIRELQKIWDSIFIM